MIKIGEFSKLSHVSIKALRYYDEVNLLKPIEVDKSSSYRYYPANQLPRLYRILALKDLGLSLEQVAQVLNEGVSPEQLRGMPRLKYAELQQHLAAEQARLQRVEAWLNTIAQEGLEKYAQPFHWLASCLTQSFGNRSTMMLPLMVGPYLFDVWRVSPGSDGQRSGRHPT
jgi:DNA-binding transcriptional MerR regulator